MDGDLCDFMYATPDESALESLMSTENTALPYQGVQLPGSSNGAGTAHAGFYSLNSGAALGEPSYSSSMFGEVNGITNFSYGTSVDTTQPYTGIYTKQSSQSDSSNTVDTKTEDKSDVAASVGQNGSEVNVKTKTVTDNDNIKSEPDNNTDKSASGIKHIEEDSVQEEELSDAQSKEHPSDIKPENIELVINNVVSCFSTRCHLNLKRIAQEGMHVVYKRENGMVSMKLRNPAVTASIWSSGKVTCTGSTSEAIAHVAARKVARQLQKIGFNVRFSKFRVVNVLGTVSLPFGIKVAAFSREHKEQACYEPELHPGVTYTIKNPKATLKIFSTGSVTVTAPSVANARAAITHIFPLVYEFNMQKKEHKVPAFSVMDLPAPHRKAQYGRHYVRRLTAQEEELDSDYGEDIDSDESRD